MRTEAKIWSPIWSPGVIWSPIWSPERLVVDLVVVDAVTLSRCKKIGFELRPLTTSSIGLVFQQKQYYWYLDLKKVAHPPPPS